MARFTSDQLNLKHLRLIVAIAEHRQVSVAAQALSITQPAASRTLAEAEARIGTRLFDRHPKGMTLTAVGESLARRARNMLDELSIAAEEVERLRQGQGGLVRIGAVTGAAVGYVVPVLRQLRAIAPDAEAQVDVGTSEDLLTGLMALRYDMVLARVPPRLVPEGLSMHPARGEVVQIVARHDHPAAGGAGPVALADLSGCDWVMQGPGAPIRRAIEDAFLAEGAPLPRNVINSASLLIALAMLRSPDAVMPISREVAQLLTEGRSDLTVLPVAQPIHVAPYSLITLSDRRLSPLAARCRDLLATLLKEQDMPLSSWQRPVTEKAPNGKGR